MKPVLLALAGMSIYTLTGLFIEQKLGKYSIAAVVLLFVAPMVAVSVIWLLVQSRVGTVSFPKGSLLWLTLFVGVLYFVADYFYIGAFQLGGTAVTISTIAIMAPVLTAVATHFLKGGWPNAYQIAGYVLAAGAVLLIAKGSPSP